MNQFFCAVGRVRPPDIQPILLPKERQVPLAGRKGLNVIVSRQARSDFLGENQEVWIWVRVIEPVQKALPLGRRDQHSDVREGCQQTSDDLPVIAGRGEGLGAFNGRMTGFHPCVARIAKVKEVGRAAAAIDLHLVVLAREKRDSRSEEHTSELQSLMRISFAVSCLKKKKTLMLQQ